MLIEPAVSNYFKLVDASFVVRASAAIDVVTASIFCVQLCSAWTFSVYLHFFSPSFDAASSEGNPQFSSPQLLLMWHREHRPPRARQPISC